MSVDRTWGRFGAGLLAAFCGLAAQAATYDLPATSATVVWGRYDGAQAPALRIRPGDIVRVTTLLTNSPQGLEKAGLAPEKVEPALRAVYDGVKDRGPGGHILTGPIYVEGAEPGDTLVIRIRKVEPVIDYGYNGFRYGVGFLTEDFPYARTKIIPLDRKAGVAVFSPTIRLPIRPFFGSMGVAPPPAVGRYDSTAPTFIGGNMDNRRLTAGATLYLPVFVPGALFEVGDGHAAQGDGESDITAVETSLMGEFEFDVVKRTGQTYPRAETPEAYIAMGFDDDLSAAAKRAVRGMVDFLVAEKGLSRDDAYMLVSVAGDVGVTELVDRNKGVHVLMPKSIFLKPAP